MTCLLGKLGIRLLFTDDAKSLWENMDLGGKESQTHTFSGDWKEKCLWGVMPRPVCLIWALGQVDHELIPTVQAPCSVCHHLLPPLGLVAFNIGSLIMALVLVHLLLSTLIKSRRGK